MSDGRVVFPVVVKLYTWLFVLGISLFPLLLALHQLRRDADHPPIPWLPVIGTILLVQLSLFYAQRRCSGAGLSYWDGMYYVTWSMYTGWAMFSFFVVMPALALLALSSVLIALLGDLRRKPELSPVYFRKVIRFFHKNRMRQ